MNRLIRLYNQNRKKFWRIIIIIASVITLIQVLNYFSSRNLNSEITNSISENLLWTESNEYVHIESNKSTVAGVEVEKSKLVETNTLLNQFYTYCNNKQLKEAYNILSDECKQEIYPNLQYFERNYYNNIFKGEKKIFSFKNWAGDTYLVTLNDDLLALGKSESSSNEINDYVTIVNNKLNISSYIGRKAINTVQTQKNIKINVIKKETYMDYEKYDIELTNNTQDTISIGFGYSADDICIRDESQIDYGYFNHEISPNQLQIPAGATKKYSFKFSSSYVVGKKIESLVLKNVILNYGSSSYDGIYIAGDSLEQEQKNKAAIIVNLQK